MDNEEWWWLYDARRPRDPRNDFAGRLTPDDCAELYDLIS